MVTSLQEEVPIGAPSSLDAVNPCGVWAICATESGHKDLTESGDA